MKFFSLATAVTVTLPMAVLGTGITAGETHCIGYGKYIPHNPTFEQAQAAYNYLLKKGNERCAQSGPLPNQIWQEEKMVDGILSKSWLSLMAAQGKWAYCKDIAAVFAHFVMNCTDTGEVGGAMDIIGTGEQDSLSLGFWQQGLTHPEK